MLIMQATQACKIKSSMSNIHLIIKRTSSKHKTNLIKNKASYAQKLIPKLRVHACIRESRLSKHEETIPLILIIY